jgi:hypothetical protein
MSKSPRRLLHDASELAAIAGVTSADLVAVTVLGDKIEFQVSPQALARIYRFFGAASRGVALSVDESGSVHATFRARGATWCCCVLAHDPACAQLRDAIGGWLAPRIGRTAEVLSLPAPEALP